MSIKKHNRIVAWILTAVAAFSLFGISSFAETASEEEKSISDVCSSESLEDSAAECVLSLADAPRIFVSSSGDLLQRGEEMTFYVMVENYDPVNTMALTPVFDTEAFDVVTAKWEISAFLKNVEEGTLRSVAVWRDPTDVNTAVYSITLRGKKFTEVTSIDFQAILETNDGRFEVDVIEKNISVVGCAEHTYPAGKDKCTVCGHFRDGIASLYGYSISLNGNIALNFYLEATEETMQDPDAYILLQMPDGSESRILLSEARTKSGNGVTYYVLNPELPAKDMSGVVSVQIVRGDGREGILYERSIRGYAEAILANASSYSATLIELLEAMLAYGDTASDYFGGVSMDPEMTEISAQILSDYAIRTDGSLGSGLNYHGSSVLLESETRIRHYFKLTAGSIEDHTFTVDGQTVTPVREGNTAYWYVDIPNVVSKDLDRAYTVCVDGFTLEYSALSYAYAALNKYSETNYGLCNVARALYLYNLAANSYFN